MSYILDALRKSEHDRQMAAGLSVGLLYPLELKRKRNSWLILTLLVVAVFVTFALAWWMWSPSTLTPPALMKASNTNTPTTTVISPPQTITQETLPEPEGTSEKILHEPETLAKAEKPVPKYTHRKIPIPHPNARQNPPTQTDSLASASAVINNAVSVDPLKNLPPLEISGYIHNEQSGNLAIINNQLVHEGEEVFPGLMLVKILDNSAIFSYRGYVFTR